jgi:hypothetical protein
MTHRIVEVFAMGRPIWTGPDASPNAPHVASTSMKNPLTRAIFQARLATSEIRFDQLFDQRHFRPFGEHYYLTGFELNELN